MYFWFRKSWHPAGISYGQIESFIRPSVTLRGPLELGLLASCIMSGPSNIFYLFGIFLAKEVADIAS